MKTLTKKLIPALLLIFGLVSLNGCGKTPQNVCGVKNPLTDLPWLNQIIAVCEENSQNGYGMPCRIYQCTYDNDKIGFLIEPCAGCPDAGYSFCSCDGTILCGGGGISGIDTCGEFNIDFTNKKLIYQHN